MSQRYLSPEWLPMTRTWWHAITRRTMPTNSSFPFMNHTRDPLSLSGMEWNTCARIVDPISIDSKRLRESISRKSQAVYNSFFLSLSLPSAFSWIFWCNCSRIYATLKLEETNDATFVFSIQPRNLLLEYQRRVHRDILGRIRLFLPRLLQIIRSPWFRDLEENSRPNFFLLSTCAWLEVKTFAYPLPYLEHVGLRRRPARQIASSIFNKALKGPRGFVERRYKVNFDVGGKSSSPRYIRE